MQIKTFVTAYQAKYACKENHAAVIIDVLRATSVITTAIENGADKIKAFLTIEEALKYRTSNNKEKILLCGERNRKLIEGFDLSNSPLEYSREIVSGKTLAMTTTNGTRAIEFSRDAEKMYIMSFLNLKAICTDISEYKNINFVCAGTENRLSLDDLVCAGKAISILCNKKDYKLDDASLLAKKLYESNSDIKKLIEESVSYKGVIKAGFESDIEFCLQEDVFEILPIYKDGFIVAKA